MVRVSSCEDLITRLMRWETGGAGTRSYRLCSLASSWVAPISSPTWASSARRTRSCPLISSSSRSPRNTSRSSPFKMSFLWTWFLHRKDILCPPLSSSVDSHPVTIIKMTGVDHWTLQKYLCFIYTGKIEFTSLSDIWETLRWWP